MATQAIKGRKAGLVLNTTGGGFTFNEVRNWSLTPTQEMLDASSCDSSGWNESIPGQRGWVFRAEAVYGKKLNDVTPAVGVAADIRLLSKALAANGKLSYFQLSVGVASTDNTTPMSSAQGAWRTSTAVSSPPAAVITNYRVGGSYDNVALFDFEVVGSGVLTYTS